MMAVEDHLLFGKFDFAFEPLETQGEATRNNMYRIKWYDTVLARPPISVLRFRKKVKSPQPDYELLKAHYCVAEILAVSGIGVKIDKLEDMAQLDAEDINPDGSTDLASILGARMLTGI